MTSLKLVPRFALLALATGLFALSAHAQTATTAPPAPAKKLGAPHGMPPQPAFNPVEFARAAPLMAQGSTAKALPGRWGLLASDLSLLDEDALMRKAGVDDRAVELGKAASEGDPIANYLNGIRLQAASRDLESGKVAFSYIERSKDLGLTRATGVLAAARYISEKNPEQREVAYNWAKAVTYSGNAFAAYMFGQALLVTDPAGPKLAADVAEKRRAEGILAIGFAAEAGLAPAQFWYARNLYDMIDKGDKDPTSPVKAKAMLAKAIAQGDAGAIAYAKERGKK